MSSAATTLASRNTVFMLPHDVDEALLRSDGIALMTRGRRRLRCAHGVSAHCNELFGDGILSAIDCVVKLEKKGERGALTIDAKFLHYKEF
jgi:ABC-type nitrate/sulfonate/bicarbonate transport system ATPase subunit